MAENLLPDEPEWAQSWLRTDRVAASVRVGITRRTTRGVRSLDPVFVGINDHLIVGRPDGQLGGGGLFVPWPGDAADRTLPRQAVRIELLLDAVRFTLAESFRGSRDRPPVVEAALNGRALTRADLLEPAHDAPVGATGDLATLELRRRTGAGEAETVAFEVQVQYSARAGLRTELAVDRDREVAVTALRERWWPKVREVQAGRVLLAASALATRGRPDDALPTAQERAALLAAAGRGSDDRLDRVLVNAVKSLFDAYRGESPRDWDAHLRVLDLAHLYTADPVEPETDGARAYRDYGDVQPFLALARRLQRAGVFEEGRG